MRGFSTGLILGIVLGAVGFWFVQKKAREHPEAEQRFEHSAAQLRGNASEAAHNMSDALRAKLDTLELRPDQIKDELTRSGKIFRRKAQDPGEQTPDAVSDARVITDTKARYAADPTLSASNISVASSQGHLSLSGTVTSPEDIGKAVAIALDMDGVRDVTATLEVKPKT